MNKFLLLVLATGTLVSCQQKPSQTKSIDLPFFNQADFTPEWIDKKEAGYSRIHTIADFEFLDQNGEVINHETVKGKVYAANFFFTICPSVCPKMTNNLQIVQNTFLMDDRVKILSHTVMPWVDTVAQLNRYAERNQINSKKWHLLTGPKEDIYSLARSSYFADEGFGKTITSSEDFLHTENIILVDQKSRIRGVYNGTLPLEIKRMIADMKQLLRDESDQR